MEDKLEITIIPNQRRTDDNRRVTANVVGEDNRRNDRRQNDRRGHHANIDLSSDDGVTKIIVWLDHNCDGVWNIGTGDSNSVGGDTVCRVRFDNDNDLKMFQGWVARGGIKEN